MINLLISSLKIGLGFIGLMTPAVMFVMWRQWKDFGEPRIKMQDIIDKTSRPNPPTGGSGVPKGNEIHLMAARLKQCEYQQMASERHSPNLDNVFSEPTPPMLHCEKIFFEQELIMLCMMYLVYQEANARKEGKSPR